MCVIYTAALGKEWDRVYAFEESNRVKFCGCACVPSSKEKRKTQKYEHTTRAMVNDDDYYYYNNNNNGYK
jgi:hypothetical protein